MPVRSTETNPTDDEPAAAAPSTFRSVARNLTLVNASVTMGALLTSPLQARALGPGGRGDLAAMLIVLGLAPLLADVGLSTFAATESARGTPIRKVIGSIGPVSLLFGLVVAAASPAIASLVAGGRSNVYWLTLAALLLMPVMTFGTLAGGIVWGTQRWGVYAATRLVLPLGTIIVFLTLYVTDHLTVVSAGITVIALTVLGLTPAIFALRGTGRPTWDRELSTRGRSFGVRVWITAIALQTNARLDQLLMIRLVAPRELGLYAIAVNVTVIQGAFTGAVGGALVPRVAGGEEALAAKALRVMITLVCMLSVGMLITVPILLPLVFGDDFKDAVPMCEILLVAAIPNGAANVMTALATALGEPSRAARAQLIGIIVTVPALIVFVGRFGGEGAAVISLVAYTTVALTLGGWLRRRLDVSLRDMLIPRREDFSILKDAPIIGKFIR